MLWPIHSITSIIFSDWTESIFCVCFHVSLFVSVAQYFLKSSNKIHSTQNGQLEKVFYTFRPRQEAKLRENIARLPGCI